jgi:hypothetical protein
MNHIEQYPLASPLVSWSIATELTDDRVSKITVDLLSRIVLTPDSKTYFETNNLLPEVLSKAGLPETTTYSVLQQLSYATAGQYYKYRLQLTIPTT